MVDSWIPIYDFDTTGQTSMILYVEFDDANTRKICSIQKVV